MLRVVEKSVLAITPHVVGSSFVAEFPEPDPQESLDFLHQSVEAGMPEFSVLTSIAFLALNLFSLVTRRRLFPALSFGDQAAVVNRLFRSGGLVSYPLVYFLSFPAVSAYYSRVDVNVLLGFDIPALKEESEKRSVARNGPPLPERPLEIDGGGDAV